MNEKVESFLNKKRAEEQEKYAKQKQKLLIDLGLFDKEYSTSTSYSAEYPYAEWDNQAQPGKCKYYKQVPIDVSDEEYEEIKKYSNIETEDNQSNPVATALTVIAWIVFIGGFISGIVLGNVEFSGYYHDYNEFSFAVAFIYWAISLVSGTMFLGFAEVIKLLQAIKRK